MSDYVKVLAEPLQVLVGRGLEIDVLTKPEDMQWLRDVHIPDLPEAYKAAVIYGNADSPDKIECYLTSEPTVDDFPDVWIRKEAL